jgi:signal transduction histidine kinase
MGVQAGAVRRRLQPGQDPEREALLAVERTGRDAVAEMRRLLGFLRSADSDSSTAALPTLRRLDDLAAEMRRAGLEVELRVEGDLDGATPGRELAAFRIVQEALTNVLKHSPGARVEVVLTSTAAALEIEVRDDGAGRVPARENGAGHGLVGMRERVGMYGGRLDAGPRDDGGFEVRATLPAGGE